MEEFVDIRLSQLDSKQRRELAEFFASMLPPETRARTPRRLSITIDYSDAELSEDPVDGTCRILRDLIDTFDRVGLTQGDTVKLRDANGNTVGRADVL